MSRGEVLEDIPSQVSANTSYVSQSSPKPQFQDKSGIPTPPIPLALPQLLEAEKRQGANNRPEQSNLEERAQSSIVETRAKELASPEWPGQLKLRDFTDTPTTQETPSNAEPADHDEHHTKPRPSLVKNTIRGLLNATKQRVSSKTIIPQPEKKSEDFAVQESELRQSIADLPSIDSQHLPELQAAPDQIGRILSTDGKCSSSHIDRISLTQVRCATGTGFSKVISRRPTLVSKAEHSIERGPPRSPIKAQKIGPTTPIRGRTHSTHSSGGRPYSLDQKFALSPSRSKSRGSCGSFTFNIKARVSPGRGLGKRDDTELFVTANIEPDDSDGSDEGR